MTAPKIGGRKSLSAEERRRRKAAKEREPLRRSRIIELRARGLTRVQILEQLDKEGFPMSQSRLQEILNEELAKMAEDLTVHRQEYWALALERLEQAIRFHQSIMLDVRHTIDQRGRAAERMIGVIARQAKMMGFDQGSTLKLSDGRSSISLDVASMDDEQLSKELQGFIGGVQATMKFVEGQNPPQIEASTDTPIAEAEVVQIEPQAEEQHG